MLPPSPRRIALHSSRNTFPTSQGSANPAMTSMSDYLLDLVGNTHAKAQRCALDFAACVVLRCSQQFSAAILHLHLYVYSKTLPKHLGPYM
jgi:hypothetical protein